ncbi:PIN domain-containing protein [Gordonia amarae]|uniref:PIN domain-containing protein n=2 Tax=Gordonia amarae TaxID=36821 RepID=G7GWG9_9ACTN|nr:PIN domain-containing protein [Gordonia amarae]MCS3877266.1 putative nucleic-acid-binding protein [Gordonia amarae]QHN16039.1 PIN domain-containing protein [Gordonia amarae]QHN20607.1 PIN domain-containing protein [Gordonia amarae]QHN29459.1 PIN domain-containing protein [Gordonia amarae]QHN38235.1 PIN domain-containing protein [Gordonia amarae]
MPAIDTNVMLRWLLDDVPAHTAAAQKLFDSTTCVVPDVVLIETVYVLERVMRLSRGTISDSIEAVLAIANLDINREIWQDALNDYRTRPKLSIADTYLASLASLSGNAPLYTFDRKLANQAESAELLS